MDMRIFTTLLVASSLFLFGCQTATDEELGATSGSTMTEASIPKPPEARVEPVELETHGDTRIDNYYWLRERENPDVIAYLEAENAYTDTLTAHTRDLQNVLFEEIKGRIKQTDTSVPYKLDDYVYYTRFEEGKEYPIYCRKKGSIEADEEVMLDVNAMAEGHEFFAVRGRQVSSGQDILAYAVDTQGRRIYTLKFKNLTTGDILPDEIPDVTGNVAWGNDNRTLFYTKQDLETLRWFQIYRHVLGTDPAQDELVYEETDDTFSAFVFKTKSKKYLMIGSSQTLSSEYRYLDANDPTGTFEVFLPRERNHEYSVDHFENHFYIRTNDQAQNFRLMKTPVTATGKEHWEEVIPHRDEVFLSGFEIFKDHLVLSERKNGLTQLRVRPWDGSEEHYLDFGEPAYLAYISTNPDFNTQVLRYGYTSMTTPTSTFDYDMETREKTLLKQQEVLGGFASEDYVTERLYATARDGVEVPISLVYRKGTRIDGTAPLLLYGYGSYGASMDATFSSSRLSLLDRGFVFAIAHIRGGQELGRQWYENGKLLKKKNTFTDFIDCGQYLIEQKYADPERIFAQGGSAGGLLMGAVVNMRPDLFNGVIAAVPWVDVVTTMLDDSIPLTTSEYDEWGNPNDKEYYDYMLSYSPYDNVEAKSYPNLLVTTGLHDSQVQYWEPAKWVAKLRTLKTDHNLLILKTNMDAGHGGASGRYKRYHEIAFQYAFLLDLAGIQHVESTAS
ncbi:MAG: S9 family peptidase [Rhodothermales bacterium]